MKKPTKQPNKQQTTNKKTLLQASNQENKHINKTQYQQINHKTKTKQKQINKL